MATAIDFQALLKQERARLLAGSDSAPKASEEKNKTEEAKKEDQGWQSLPDNPLCWKQRQRIDLEKFAVAPEVVSGVYYIPDFISHDEAEGLLQRTYELPEVCWTNLRRRRLQNHGGTPHPDGMIPERMPRFLEDVLRSLVECGVFAPDEPPNHILLNEYKLGQGIMPHKDGPLYQPLVAILSLDGPAMLCFWDSLQATKAGQPAASVLCFPNSLLVFSQDAYETHWHGILEAQEDEVAEHTGNRAAVAAAGLRPGQALPRGARRVSLTCRRVLRLKDEERRVWTGEGREEERRRERWWLASRGEEGVVDP